MKKERVANVSEMETMPIRMLAFLLIPEALITIYDVSEAVLEMAILAFRILALGFVFAGISLINSASFQAIGKGVYSLIVNMSRQLVTPVVLLLILKNFFGVTGIWIAFSVAEVFTMLIALFLRKRCTFSDNPFGVM